MTREDMIQLLVVHGVEYVDSFRGILWLQKVLEQGFAGYANMSDDALAAEIVAQGLDRFADCEDDNEEWSRRDDDVDLTVLAHEYEKELQDW